MNGIHRLNTRHEHLLLQCVAVCCSAMQCDAVFHSVLLTVCGNALQMLQCVAVCYSVLQCVAVCCSVLQCVAVCCSVLQCVTVCCSVLQCVAVCCSVLQCVADSNGHSHVALVTIADDSSAIFEILHAYKATCNTLQHIATATHRIANEASAIFAILHA